MYVPRRPSKFPIAPMGETHVLLVFTGRRCLCLFRHRHNDVLLDHRQHSFWIGACSCGNFPSPRWEFLLTCPIDSHLSIRSIFGSIRDMYVPATPANRPDGIFTCFALVLAGRRCVHQQWHGELLIVHHHGQLSWLCACSCSKLPIAPMGFSHVLR